MRRRLIEALEALEHALAGWDRDYLPELRQQTIDTRNAIETIESEVYLDERSVGPTGD